MRLGRLLMPYLSVFIEAMLYAIYGLIKKHLLILSEIQSPWLTRICFTRILLMRIFKKFPFLI